MKPFSFPLAAVTLAALLVSAAPRALAHEGDDEAPPSAEVRTLPRFAATSERFELVGVFDGASLTLYLDRHADNAPVGDARIALRIGEMAVSAEAHGAGEFRAEWPMTPAPGEYRVIATVMAGGQTDTLTADLDIHEEAHAADATQTALAARPWTSPAALAGLCAAVLGLAVAGWRLRRAGGAK
ncbi:MAG: hypothetical protein LBP86_08000 [Azoarcus sp.]|jgi:hypothetical protein|nr:hypothetical protein [Azoarcus sp.]